MTDRKILPDVTASSPEELISLAGRAAVVIGGAQGIGFAVARRYAQAGARVLVADLRGEAAAAAAAKLGEEVGGTVESGQVDIASSDSVEALADAAVERLGGLDIWANFAALYPIRVADMHPALDFPDADWQRTIDTNLGGAFYGSRAAARRMVAAGKAGVIINTMSTLVDRFAGHPGMVAYAASKGGIEQLTKVLAAEWGPNGIRVLALKPTVVSTEGLDEHRALLTEHLDRDPFGELEAMMPLGRFGVPDDLARLALVAASDLGLWLTGSVIVGDGGELSV
ncbi:MAG: SDR family NAD(P)-dependent oxidoreductase [Solirubrobacterales bacterium]